MLRKSLTTMLLGATLMINVPLSSLATPLCVLANEAENQNYFTVDQTGTSYPTLQAAINAANKIEGEDVTITVNVSTYVGEGLKFSGGLYKSLTIDFNNCDYQFSDPSVGSTGTETQAIQVIKNQNVILKNGKLSISEITGEKAEFKMFIHNYGNLSLEGLILDGSKMISTPGYNYILDTDFGNSSISGCTFITNSSFTEAPVLANYYVNKSGTYNAGVSLEIGEGNSFSGNSNGDVELIVDAGGTNGNGATISYNGKSYGAVTNVGDSTENTSRMVYKVGTSALIPIVPASEVTYNSSTTTMGADLASPVSPNGQNAWLWFEITNPNGQVFGIAGNGNSTLKNFAWNFSDMSSFDLWPEGVSETGQPINGTYTINCYVLSNYNGSKPFNPTETNLIGKAWTQTITLPTDIKGISVSPSNASIYVGSQTTLTATLTPADVVDSSVMWASSNPSIATVDSNGKVKGISAGTVTITVTAANGMTATATVTVTVPSATTPPADSTEPDNPSTPDSPTGGENNGVPGTGEGFTEPGSTTKPAENGGSITFTQDEDGTKTATTQNPDGEVTSVDVTVPSTAITDGKVSVDLGTNKNTGDKLTIVGNKTDEDEAPSLDIKLPANTKADVEVTVQNGTMKPGTVAMIEDENGKLVPIPTTTSDGNVLNIPLDGSQKVYIVDNAKTFADVAGVPSYATNAAAYVSARDLMTGMGATEPKPFSFDTNLTRGQFATILYRLAGEPKGSGAYPEGIIPGAWNADAARWAVQMGLMAQGGAAFNPQGDISREQIIAIMWRMQNKPIVSDSKLDGYNDVDQIQSDDFKQAMAWAVSIGIVGQGTDNLDPNSDASRAEIAAMIQRFIQAVY